MRITGLLPPCSIALGGCVATKAEAIRALTGLMAASGCLADPDSFEADVLLREAECTTGVGGGLAIPHAKSAAVRAPGLAALTLREGMDYQSLDGQPVRLLFLLAAPQNADAAHIQMLAELARLLLTPGLADRLLAAQSPADFRAVLDAAQAADGAAKAALPPAAPPVYRVLAVTACPTGIAHTYMAAEALENTALALGISLKVETNGADGVKNTLTEAEIAQCRGVLVAADKAVPMTRFTGKPLLRVPVGEAIRRPRELLEQADGGLLPPYGAAAPPLPAVPLLQADASPGALPRSETLPRRLYRSLMTGVTYMLPFVIAGVVLLSLSYLFDRANFGSADFGTGTALAGFCRTVGNYGFSLMFPVLAGGIAFSIADRPALVPGMVGGLLAQMGMTMQGRGEWVPSGMWGAILAGFAAGYLMQGIRRGLKNMPRVLDSTRTVLLYPVLGALAIGAMMVFLINPWVGRFNQWLYQGLFALNAGERVAMGALLGLMMAIDFGGPVSKVAYLFATASIVAGEYDIMAAVMAGGMVPPLGVALACTFFGSRFTKKERQTTLTNYLMGASFITEGVIPFALRDPIHVIPACMAGSALAGAYAEALGCGCPVPHGGIYVIGLVVNPQWFLMALALGSAATALLLAIFKKPLSPAAQEGCGAPDRSAGNGGTQENGNEP